jgi:hypothetical protein
MRIRNRYVTEAAEQFAAVVVDRDRKTVLLINGQPVEQRDPALRDYEIVEVSNAERQALRDGYYRLVGLWAASAA